MFKKFSVVLLVMVILTSCNSESNDNQSMNTDGEKTEKDNTTTETIDAETTDIVKGIYQSISPEEANSKLAEGTEVLLIDVREQSEYDSGHIPGSILLPVGTIEQEVEAMIPSYDTPLIVYCRSGNRSRTAADILLELGYTEVYDLGGINDWPYEIVLD
ncbi:MAG: rhodanese-like domain-containing protein [Vallitaleaceae bacterium]|jgi:phage shock protein E|nr:rhodanese-like domain-containing protein [Vallitaleaceae bacterium]